MSLPVQTGSAARDPRSSLTRVVAGRQAILALAPELERFAAQCNQQDALHWLPFFLAGRGMRFRKPTLVLVLKREHADGVLSAEHLEGAGVFFEYVVYGVRSRASICDNIVAEESRRTAIASLCTEVILRQGAHVVSTLFWQLKANQQGLLTRMEQPGLQWAQLRREGQRRMALADTYEGTLAKFSKSTRTNFRYYRKRFEEAVASDYVLDVRTRMTQAELAELNSDSRNPISAMECRLRYENSFVHESGFVSSVRDTEGRWISAIGGWRSGNSVIVHWQSNRAGYEKHSLVAAMRAMFLENETLRGTRELLFYGGTSHVMHKSFDRETVCYLLVRRKTLRVALLQLVARAFARKSWWCSRPNHLAMMLCDPKLQWHEGQPAMSVASVPATATDG